MNFSYWEHNTWLQDIDFAVIGSGIVGLSCALSLRSQHPNSKIVIFEKGMLPSGASTKNAGFACFGSLSEILEDLTSHTEEEVVSLIKARVTGLELLRKALGDKTLDYQVHGGYELFRNTDQSFFEECVAKMPYINKLLHSFFKQEVFSLKENGFGFAQVQPQLVYNAFEGQIDTGKMMLGLLKKASEENILVLNNAEVTRLEDINTKVVFQLNHSEEISAKKIAIATNGFAKQFLTEDITPARAQVLITQPIKNLAIKGTFHLDKGYYYFRNIHDRILFGGGRNLAFKTETTTQAGTTAIIQEHLEHLLATTILPGQPFEVAQRWSGIMGVGKQKKPIVKSITKNVSCGIRLGGMGVAIGSTIGQQLANIINNEKTI